MCVTCLSYIVTGELTDGCLYAGLFVWSSWQSITAASSLDMLCSHWVYAAAATVQYVWLIIYKFVCQSFSLYGLANSLLFYLWTVADFWYWRLSFLSFLRAQHFFQIQFQIRDSYVLHWTSRIHSCRLNVSVVNQQI